jgi:hypothetical protein
MADISPEEKELIRLTQELSRVVSLLDRATHECIAHGNEVQCDLMQDYAATIREIVKKKLEIERKLRRKKLEF